MKWYLIFAVLFSCILLHGVTFTHAYHRDYGVIDRVVLVFDSAPKYKIDQLQNVLFVEVFDASAKPGINLDYSGSDKLIQNFIYKQTDQGITISIAASQIARISSFDFAQEQAHKLVIDIFSLDAPRTAPDATSFACFFRTLGYADSASHYETLAVTLPDSLPISQPVHVEPDTGKQPVQPSAVHQTPAQSKPAASSLSWLIPVLMVVCGGVIFLALWGLTRMKHKRNSAKPSCMRNRDGFAPRELLELMVKDLHAHGWETQAIADEMQVELDVIKEILNK